MHKRAQSMTINVVIVAAIALIVLVVLVAIFTGRIGLFTKGISTTGTCESFGGTCQLNACEPVAKMIVGALNCDRDFNGDGTTDNLGKPNCCKP